MSEPELRRAVESCVEAIERRGRPQLAQRVRARLELLIGSGQAPQALAVIGLFRSPRGA